MGATLIMIIALKIQRILRPYKLDSNNKLEFSEIITGTMTVFACIIFSHEEDNVFILDLAVFLIGIFISSLFLL